MLTLEQGCLLSFGLLLRAIASVHPHSGQGQPPMFGDYEAQRHWQEVTVNLPVQDWYYNTTDNDLLYWGLDYPPLTAYHSWLVGQVAKVIDPSYVTLHESRGREDYHHKIFMRNSVLISDLLVLIPAILAFVGQDLVALAAFLLYPGLILIDNGHFQYNNMSLGLFTLALAFVMKDCILKASMAFVLALSYKQMELYHALPFFFYFLGLCLRKERSWTSAFVKLVKIGLVVVFSFGLVWWPFAKDLKQVLVRIFPLNRGLFEDKVANIWCSLNVVLKLKDNYSSDQLALLSALVTLALVLPSNLALFWRPSKDQFIYALLNTSLIFFLCSYQVHEKSILLVAFPALMTLKVIDPRLEGRFHKLILSWFLLSTTFSMWPLLQKDDLCLAFLALQGIYITFCHYVKFFDVNQSLTSNKKRSSPKPMTSNDLVKATCQDWLIWTLFNLSMIGYVVFCFASLYLMPPVKYPHLWPLLISVYSAGHFVAFWVYFSCCQYKTFVNEFVSSDKKTK